MQLQVLLEISKEGKNRLIPSLQEHLQTTPFRRLLNIPAGKDDSKKVIAQIVFCLSNRL